MCGGGPVRQTNALMEKVDEPMYAKDVPPGQIFYHGTKADLKVGEQLAPGYGSNFVERELNHIID